MTGTKLLVRTARSGDIEAMHRIRLSVRENRLARIVIGVDDYERELRSPGRGWVATHDDVVLGFAIANAHTGNVWAFFVDPDHEGRGVGRALHAAMMEWLRASCAVTPFLETAAGSRAERFYRRAGWLVTGRAGNGDLRMEWR